MIAATWQRPSPADGAGMQVVAKLAIVIVVMLMSAARVQAGDGPPPAVQKVFDAFEKPIDVAWRQRPLDQGLGELLSSQGLKLTIDAAAAAAAKKPLSLRLLGEPLGEVLDRVTDRCGLDMTILADGSLLLVKGRDAGATTVPAWVQDPRPVRVALLGGYRRERPLNGWADPVPALGDSDEDELNKPAAKLDAKVLKSFVDRYVDRIEAWHMEPGNNEAHGNRQPGKKELTNKTHGKPAPELLAFFKAHPDVRREFWLAIDPRYDDATAACRIMNELLTRAGEKKLTTFQHLAIAIAVVYDSDDAPRSSRYYFLWAVHQIQFGETLKYAEIFDYFSDPANQASFVFTPAELAWPLMTHLVDLDVSRTEIDWVFGQYGKGKNVDLQSCYSQVPYDNAKLAHTGTALGDRPYTLANLLQYGGVCVDQSHYASRVAKIFGVPSLKCGGAGRYGGVSHAWSGYLAVDAQSHAPVLEFTGRYQYDFYYTGEAFDPQRRVQIVDRQVELMFRGMSGTYETYRDAAALTRAAVAVEESKPTTSLALVREALKTNPYVADAWRLAFRHAVTGTLPTKEADQLFRQMLKNLGRYPDLVVEILDTYLDAVDTMKPEARLKLYDETAAICLAVKPARADLLIRVRLGQLGELTTLKRTKDAITLAFNTLTANAKEGTLVMPLVARVVTMAKQLAATDASFQLRAVKDGFIKASQDFPKERGPDVSPAWLEWQRLVGSL